MRTSRIVLLGLGVAMAILLSAGAVYGVSRQVAPQQGAYPSTTGGYGYGYGPGMMGNYPYYSGGATGGYGGMMGGYAGTPGWYGGMMGGYGGFTGGWGMMGR